MFTLAVQLNLDNYASPAKPLLIAIGLGSVVSGLGYAYPRVFWKTAYVWGAMILLLFLRNGVIFGHFAWTGLTSKGNPVLFFYFFVFILSSVIGVIMIVYARSEVARISMNSFVTSIVAPFGAVSCFACFFEFLSKQHNPFAVLHYFAIPSTLQFAYLMTWIMLFLHLALSSGSIYLNRLRYKQFGMVLEGEEADSLLKVAENL